jgi:HTH-type transcriptional regulator, sugar sensing transcriptional regulator
VSSVIQRDEVLNELERIGLSPYEARTYVALLTSPPVNGYDLARLSGIPTSKIYETLQRLVAKGIALASATEPTLYRAVPPGELIAGVRQDTERSLGLLADALPEISAAPSAGIVWRLNDQQSVLRYLEEIVSNASREVFLSIWPPEAGYLAKSVAAARQRGVRLWVASFGPSPLDGETVYDLLSCGTSSAARLGKRLTVAVGDDRHVLIAQFRDDAEPTGTLADDPSLALVAREYIIHDLVNHALIEALGQDRFSLLRSQHPLVAGILGPVEPTIEPAGQGQEPA